MRYTNPRLLYLLYFKLHILRCMFDNVVVLNVYVHKPH